MLLQASNETDGVLNFTVQPHFPAQIYSSPIREPQVLPLLHLPDPSEPPRPFQCWDRSFGSRNSTQVVLLQANAQSVSSEETKQNTTPYTPKAWQV